MEVKEYKLTYKEKIILERVLKEEILKLMKLNNSANFKNRYNDKIKELTDLSFKINLL